MAKQPKIDTVFFEYMPAAVPTSDDWTSNIDAEEVARTTRRLVSYVVSSLAFLIITTLVFYGLFVWLLNFTS